MNKYYAFGMMAARAAKYLGRDFTRKLDDLCTKRPLNAFVEIMSRLHTAKDAQYKDEQLAAAIDVLAVDKLDNNKLDILASGEFAKGWFRGSL